MAGERLRPGECRGSRWPRIDSYSKENTPIHLMTTPNKHNLLLAKGVSDFSVDRVVVIRKPNPFIKLVVR